ncbi:MAG: hypothetical protein JWP97_2063 [Labilithrix sp.]|nr:hypothetical protein [Labilithrix sp.]
MLRRPRLWTLLAYLPVAIVAFGSAMFIRNHFYVRGPYLHDSGWFSATVYHAGLVPENPPSLRGPLVSYWGWHVSVIVSLGSMLSYLFPVDRVDWYCVFQAVIYAALAFAMPVLVPARQRSSVRSGLAVLVANLLFSLSGQVLCCLGYPHFEIFASAGLAVMLAGLATGRTGVAWTGIVMALATREDGGIHAAMFLGAALALDLTGRPFPVSRRKLIVMAVVAAAVAVLTSVAQKRLFVTVDAWHQYLAGNPPYAHVTRALVLRRLDFFATHSGYVWLPMVVTALIAAARRDARYLLGWAFSMPWLLFNFFAFQELKGELSVYTGFPFVGALFWPAAFATSEAARRGRSGSLWPLAAGALVSIASTLGMVPGSWNSLRFLAADMFIPKAENPAGIRAFARHLRRRDYGAVYMSPAAASWALEGLHEHELVAAVFRKPDLTGADGYAFHINEDSFEPLVGSKLTTCGRVVDTGFFFCGRAGGALPEGLEPASPLMSGLHLVDVPQVRREHAAIRVDAALPPQIRVFGPYLHAPPGAYTARWTVDYGGCPATSAAPILKVDILRAGEEIVGILDAESITTPVELPFDVTPENHERALELRMFSGSCPYVLRALEVRPRTP